MPSYRLLTLNTAFLPRTPISPSLPDYPYRADKIAEIIKRDQFDIVLLNEVFVPEIRARLVRNLEDTYAIPGGLDIREFLRDGEFFDASRDRRSASTFGRSASVRSVATHQIRQIQSDSATSCTATRRRTLDTWRDVPFIDSGLFFAYRKNRGIICPDAPSFVPWSEHGIESVTARMGFFFQKIGLRHTSSPVTFHAIGLHMNPYARHRDIRAAQFQQLAGFVARLDEDVFSPSLKIVAGDFNVIGETDEYEATIGSETIANSEDLFKVVNPEEPGYTWDSSNPLTDYALDSGNANERLDYILSVKHPRCRKRLKDIHVQVAPFAVPDYEYEFASDHYGLSLDFDVESV